MERACCFFIGNLSFIHVLNTQPQLGVPQLLLPVSFCDGAAGCWIQTRDPVLHGLVQQKHLSWHVTAI